MDNAKRQHDGDSKHKHENTKPQEFHLSFLLYSNEAKDGEIF